MWKAGLQLTHQPVWSSYPPKRQSEGAITFALVSLKKKKQT